MNLAPGEHPDLPRLRIQLYGPQPTTRVGRRAYPGHPAYARYHFSPLPVIVTSNPERIRGHATALLELADALEAALAETQEVEAP